MHDENVTQNGIDQHDQVGNRVLDECFSFDNGSMNAEITVLYTGRRWVARKAGVWQERDRGWRKRGIYE